MELQKFIDGFFKMHLDDLLEEESEKRRRDDGMYEGWDVAVVANIKERIENSLKETYDSVVDAGGEFTPELVEDVYQMILDGDY